MTKKLRIVLLIISFVSIISLKLFAADSMYRFKHNDQDLLVIGEIIGEDSENYLIEVSHFLVSDKNMTQDAKIFNERPSKVRVSKNFNYLGFGEKVTKPKQNDYILISLHHQSDDLYKCKWGAYNVSSLDYKTLNIIKDKNISDGIKADIAAVEYFVNSNGRYSDFSYRDNRVYVNESDGKIIQIYPMETSMRSITKALKRVGTDNYRRYSIIFVGLGLIASTIIIKNKLYKKY